MVLAVNVKNCLKLYLKLSLFYWIFLPSSSIDIDEKPFANWLILKFLFIDSALLHKVFQLVVQDSTFPNVAVGS